MFFLNDDTICAPATVPGSGAISIIRVSGGEALGIVSSVVRCAPGREVSSAPGYSARFGRVFLPDGSLLDEVIVTVFRAPHSYTGEDSAEISCHASKYIVENILLLLIEAGARSAAPGEFTRRAFLNGKMDLAQAEAVADLIAAQNAASHRVALNQLKGNFSVELKKMRNELLNIVSLMELELDFSEEEVEFADRSHLHELVSEVVGHISGLIDSFRYGNAIKNGIPVAIVGATNTGKSTLLNALVGEERAIVSDVHGTTRDTVEETMTVNGLLFRFIDTAGIRSTDEEIERLGIERTFRKIREAQVVLGMVDVTRPLAETGESVSAVLSHFDASSQKLLFVLNKLDLADVSEAARSSGGAGVMDGMNKADVSDAAGASDVYDGADEMDEMDEMDEADLADEAGMIDGPAGHGGEDGSDARDCHDFSGFHDFRQGDADGAAGEGLPSCGLVGNKLSAGGPVEKTDAFSVREADYQRQAKPDTQDKPAYPHGSPADTSDGQGMKAFSVCGSAGNGESSMLPASNLTHGSMVSSTFSSGAGSMAGARGAYPAESEGDTCGNKNVYHVNNIISFIDNKCVDMGIPILPHVFISAKRGVGITELKAAISDICRDYAAESDAVVVTNARHFEALSSARDSLLRVEDGLSSAVSTDLVAQDIREAIYHLGSIVGEISTDEVLGNIFKNFCIGK